jgi:hypothetical protein
VKTLRFACLSAVLCILFGCSTTAVTLRYEPTAPIQIEPDAKPVAVVGSIKDVRKEDDPRWFGAIRGGFGNPLKKLVGDKPMSETVAQSLSDALKERRLLASGDNAAIRVEGTIQELDCNYYWNRDAHAQLQLNLVDAKSNVLLYTQSQRADNSETGVGAGIFGDVNHLAEFMQQTLNQVIDKFFADPVFMAALVQRKVSSATSTVARVDELRNLKQSGLISNGEYEARRNQVFEGSR